MEDLEDLRVTRRGGTLSARDTLRFTLLLRSVQQGEIQEQVQITCEADRVTHGPLPLSSESTLDKLRRARFAAALLFLLFGISSGAWASRIPAIKDQAGVSNGELGVALLAAPLGGLLVMQLGGPILHRFGSARIVMFAIVLEPLAGVSPALAHGVVSLTVAMLTMGLGWGALDVSVNTQASVIEHHYKRPLMSGVHGFWSLGGLLGALAGSQAAAHDLSPLVHFGVTAVIVVVVGIPTCGRLLPLSADVAADETREGNVGGKVTWSRILLLLGLMTFCSFLAEGVANDWSAVYLHENIGASDAVAATGFAAYSLAMCLSRFSGDRLTIRFGRQHLVQYSALIGATGLGLSLLASNVVLAIAGWMILGIGLAVVVPIAFAAAGSQPGMARGGAIARVASLGWIGSLIGPPIVGVLAEVVGLTAALCLPLLLIIGIAVMASAVATDW